MRRRRRRCTGALRLFFSLALALWRSRGAGAKSALNFLSAGIDFIRRGEDNVFMDVSYPPLMAVTTVEHVFESFQDLPQPSHLLLMPGQALGMQALFLFQAGGDLDKQIVQSELLRRHPFEHGDAVGDVVGLHQYALLCAAGCALPARSGCAAPLPYAATRRLALTGVCSWKEQVYLGWHFQQAGRLPLHQAAEGARCLRGRSPGASSGPGSRSSAASLRLAYCTRPTLMREAYLVPQ